jgi:ATP-dependent DNA ligase
VRLQSRHQRPLDRYFPDIAAAVAAQLPYGAIVDGELVAWRSGRLDFMALQPRLHSPRTAPPAHLLLFDVLADRGDDIRHLPYHARRDRLESLLAGVEAPLALVPTTVEPVAARAWLHEHIDVGIEGIVAKHLDHPYRPSRRSWRVDCTKIAPARGAGLGEETVGGVVRC